MKKINRSFICRNCGHKVDKADRTCRNHCNVCLVSKHVDRNVPGDRSSKCNGRMVPVSYKLKWDKVKILFECLECGKQHWNKRAIDDNLIEIDSLISKYKKRYNL